MHQKELENKSWQDYRKAIKENKMKFNTTLSVKKEKDEMRDELRTKST